MFSLSQIKKRYWFIGGIALVVAFGGYWRYSASHKPVEYETVRVERGDLQQTVDATGKITSSNALSLRFETPGILDEVKVKEGDTVKAGQELAHLRLAELNAALAEAQANLNKTLAGVTPEEIRSYEAAAEVARVDWEKAKVDRDKTVSDAELALATAQNNLNLAAGGESSQIVQNEYEGAIATLHDSLQTVDNALTQADSILGVDNSYTSANYYLMLSNQNTSYLSMARDFYLAAKKENSAARIAVDAAINPLLHSPIDNAITAAESALLKTTSLLTATNDVLSATSPGAVLSQGAIDGMKTSINTVRSSVGAQLALIIKKRQSIAAAKNLLTERQIAYEKAVRDLANAKSSGESMVNIKYAAYDQALANLERVKVPPRTVDVAPLRAALAQVAANRERAILRAPIDGVVTKVNKKRGELVGSTEVAIEMLSPHFEIEVDIPETDVAKLMLANTTTITLDAFGDTVKLSGHIMTIDPGSTEIQDVVYYRVRVALDPTELAIKSGMTANVVVQTATRQGVLFAPLRALRLNDDGTYTARVLNANHQITETSVKTGIRANEGKIEILDGVKENDELVLKEKSAS